MDLQHFEIKRACLFNIPEEQENRTAGIPSGGQALVDLSASAKIMVAKRLTAALGKNSNGVELSIVNSGASSFFQLASEAIDGDDSNFLEKALEIANMLSAAQVTKHLAESKLMVIQGAVTAGKLPFFMVVKAELQDGFTETVAKDNIPAVNHLTDIFMTESQKLFKIGYLYRKVATPVINDGIYDVNDCGVHLFDHLVTSTETRSAAFYFYNTFMGCNTAASAKARTRDFYENTMEFIRSSGLSSDEKIDLIEALRTELRSNNNTINVITFASTYFPKPVVTAYQDFMIKNKGFPNHAVVKDLTYVADRLKRRRKIKFSSGVDISSPPDIISQIKVTPNDDGSTSVIIPGMIESRE